MRLIFMARVLLLCLLRGSCSACHCVGMISRGASSVRVAYMCADRMREEEITCNHCFGRSFGWTKCRTRFVFSTRLSHARLTNAEQVRRCTRSISARRRGRNASSSLALAQPSQQRWRRHQEAKKAQQLLHLRQPHNHLAPLRKYTGI